MNGLSLSLLVTGQAWRTILLRPPPGRPASNGFRLSFDPLPFPPTPRFTRITTNNRHAEADAVTSARHQGSLDGVSDYWMILTSI